VYVESLIAEVNADKVAEFGIQWQGAIGKNGDGSIGLLGTNFGAGGNNLNAGLGGRFGGARYRPECRRGVNRTNGIYVLGFLARFLQQTATATSCPRPTC
jgi:general secretion pathway protein D